MTRLLELPSDEQDAIAVVLMTELESERRWERAFDATAEQLSRLADEALGEHREGKTEPFDSHGS